MVVGTPYERPGGVLWSTMFAIFFVLGGLCSTLIPLTFGSDRHWIGKYMATPASGRALDSVAPEDLGLADLPPAMIFIGSAIVAMSMLSCVIQKLEFPECALLPLWVLHFARAGVQSSS